MLPLMCLLISYADFASSLAGEIIWTCSIVQLFTKGKSNVSFAAAMKKSIENKSQSGK